MDYGEFAAVYTSDFESGNAGPRPFRAPRVSGMPETGRDGAPAPGAAPGPERGAEAGIARTIVLIGLMGVGKSCIGRRLAASLGLEFVDADAEVEAAAGCSIQDIFDCHGEAAFRDCERRVIARLLGQPPHVLATGGGAFMDPDTRALIKERGISLWLRGDLPLLVKRTARRNNRPLLKRGNPEEILARLMQERYPVYAEADMTVDSHDGPPEVTLRRARAALEAHLAGPAPGSGSGPAP